MSTAEFKQFRLENRREIIDCIDNAFQCRDEESGNIILDEIFIDTLEGGHYASVGDFIIKGVVGEFYPCKPHVFAATYERVES